MERQVIVVINRNWIRSSFFIILGLQEFYWFLWHFKALRVLGQERWVLG